MKLKKKFVVTVVSGMHSDGTVLSASERRTKSTEQSNGKWVGGVSNSAGAAPLLFFSLNAAQLRATFIDNLSPESEITFLSLLGFRFGFLS